MATAKLLDAVKRDNRWKITVEYTDGAIVKVESYSFAGVTAQQLKDFIRSKLSNRDSIKDADFSAFVGKEIDLSQPVTPDPTAEEIAKAAWFDDFRKLERLLRLVNAGLIQSDDSRITALQTSLIAGWLNSYLGDL